MVGKRTNTFYSRNLRILCRGRGLRYFDEVGVDAVVRDHYRHRDLVRTGLKSHGTGIADKG